MNATKQEAFNVVWNGLRAQGFVHSGPAQDGHGTRPKHNGCLHCAYGYLDNAYGYDDGYKALMLIPGIIPCHDDAADPADMERRLREFAAAHSLTISGYDFPAFMAKVQEPVKLAEKVLTVPAGVFFCEPDLRNPGKWLAIEKLR